jgi:hypothetical protein
MALKASQKRSVGHSMTQESKLGLWEPTPPNPPFPSGLTPQAVIPSGRGDTCQGHVRHGRGWSRLFNKEKNVKKIFFTAGKSQKTRRMEVFSQSIDNVERMPVIGERQDAVPSRTHHYSIVV